MKIHLTGHRGFLGSHLTEAFTRQGFSVTNQTGRISVDSVSRWSLDDCDAVVHLAARTPQSANSHGPIDYQRDNNISECIGGQCLKSNTRLIFASSANVYRESSELLSENSELDPQTPYARAKRDSEEAFIKLWKQGLECFILRLFNPFGTRLPPAYFIPYVMRQALQNKEVELKSPANVRDYIHINDVKDVFARTILFGSDEYRSLIDSPVFNVGSGCGLSGIEVIKAVELAMDRELKLSLPEPVPTGNCYVADIAKAKSILGFQAKTEFRDGLRMSIGAEPKA